MNIPFVPRISRRELQNYLVAVFILLLFAIAAVLLRDRVGEEAPPVIGNAGGSSVPSQTISVNTEALEILRGANEAVAPISLPGEGTYGRDNPFQTTPQGSEESEEQSEAAEQEQSEEILTP